MEISKFQFGDSTLPILKSGFYLVSNADSGNLISKKLYDISNNKNKSKDMFFNLTLKDFVSFSNIDTLYSQESNSEYKGFFDIILKLNPIGQKQLSELTAKTKTLTEDEKYDGLILGTVINNTLIQISHVHQQIDTNVISIAGGSFYEQTVNNILKYLEKGRNSN